MALEISHGEIKKQPQRRHGFGSLLRSFTTHGRIRNGDYVSPYKYNTDVFKRSRLTEAKMVADLFSEPRNAPESLKILDVASGTGSVAHEIAKQGYQVTALDINPEYLEEQQKKDPSIKTVLTDMNESFPFPSNTFDGVTTLLANRFIQKPDKFAEEVFRVLKPEGVFFWPIFNREKKDWEHNLRTIGENQPVNDEALQRILKSTGFTHVKINYQVDRSHQAKHTDLPYIAAMKPNDQKK